MSFADSIPGLLLNPQRFKVHPYYVRLNFPEQTPAPFSPKLSNQLGDIIAPRQLTNRIKPSKPKVFDDGLAGRSGQHTSLTDSAAYALPRSRSGRQRL